LSTPAPRRGRCGIASSRPWSAPKWRNFSPTIAPTRGRPWRSNCARFNPELNKSWFGGVMEVINNITMLSIVLTGAALIREREHGTVEYLLVMPVTPFEIMSAKVWAMALVVLVAATFALTVVVQGWLGVPIEGSVALPWPEAR